MVCGPIRENAYGGQEPRVMTAPKITSPLPPHLRRVALRARSFRWPSTISLVLAVLCAGGGDGLGLSESFFRDGPILKLGPLILFAI